MDTGTLDYTKKFLKDSADVINATLSNEPLI